MSAPKFALDSKYPLEWGFTCPTPSDCNKKGLMKNFLNHPNFSKIFKLGFLNPILVTKNLHIHINGHLIYPFSVSKHFWALPEKNAIRCTFWGQCVPLFCYKSPKSEKNLKKNVPNIAPRHWMPCTNICWGRRTSRGGADSFLKNNFEMHFIPLK